MGIISDIFGKICLSDGKIRKACDSDILSNIVEAIRDNSGALKSNLYDKALNYLSAKGNLGMKLRVMTLNSSSPRLMRALLALDPSDAPKLTRLCKDGHNPVLHFSMLPDMEIPIRLLAHAHANLDIVGHSGATPLTLACERGLSKTVTMLINNGAKAINQRDGSGFAPLHYACQLGNFEIVKTLLTAGADVNVISSDNLMPIHLAISTSQAALYSPKSPTGIAWNSQNALTCVEMLANNGADLDYVCPYGFSARSFFQMIGRNV